MDIKEQYNDLAVKMKNNLPLKALPIRQLVQIFREKGQPVTLKTVLTITDVFNSGDISGIMCTVHDDEENVMICALTHLIFSPKIFLFKEIKQYQRKRDKRVEKLNKLGLN